MGSSLTLVFNHERGSAWSGLTASKYCTRAVANDSYNLYYQIQTIKVDTKTILLMNLLLMTIQHLIIGDIAYMMTLLVTLLITVKKKNVCVILRLLVL